MVDDNRGACGDADANKGVEGVSINGRGPLKSNSSALTFNEALRSVIR